MSKNALGIKGEQINSEVSKENLLNIVNIFLKEFSEIFEQYFSEAKKDPYHY